MAAGPTFPKYLSTQIQQPLTQARLRFSPANTSLTWAEFIVTETDAIAPVMFVQNEVFETIEANVQGGGTTTRQKLLTTSVNDVIAV